MRTICLSVLLSLFAAAPAFSCAWDRDTLAEEAAGATDAVRAILGAFPVNPPLYYEMRLERVSAELDADPSLLAHYDDAGVACDRLGRNDEAIEWMAYKREQLLKLRNAAKKEEQPNHWYRYYANLGTFYAHRWIKLEDRWQKLDDLEQARSLIAKAIELNPDAHFGREVYQLHVHEWLLKWGNYLQHGLPNVPDGEDPERYKPRTLYEHIEPDVDTDEATAGLSGLIVLGAAQHSIDIHLALGHFLGIREDTSLAHLAANRVQELLDDGAKSIIPESECFARDLNSGEVISSMRLFGLIEHKAHVESEFKRLRRIATDWQEKRETYMLERLSLGMHPDTHPEFWADFSEDPSTATDIEFETSVSELVPGWLWQSIGWIAAQAFLVFAVLGIVTLARRGRRKRMAREATSAGTYRS